MLRYRLSPYVSFVESHLIPGVIQHGVFHRLTGEVLQPNEGIRRLLQTASVGNCISLDEESLSTFGREGAQLKEILEKWFLIAVDTDPLSTFVDRYVIRPLQNPALMYRRNSGEISLVYT